MNFVWKSENVLRNSLVLMLLLAGLAVGTAVAQHKPSAPAPKASAPKAKAPAARPSTGHPSTATHSSTNGARPGAAGTHTTPGGARAGTAGRTGTGTAGRNGNARGPAGGTHTPSAANRTGGSRTGGSGNTARTGSRPAPGRQVSLKGGGTASIRPNGQIRSINRNGMHIEHGLNGSRRIESTHNGAHIVTTGRGSGYVQRAYVTRGGHSYVSRTTIINHRAYTGVYRSYSYEDTAITVTIPRFITDTLITGGPTIRGQRRFITAGVGGSAVVWILRRVFRALSGLSLGRILADGLSDLCEPASGLCGAGGCECRRERRGRQWGCREWRCCRSIAGQREQ